MSTRAARPLASWISDYMASSGIAGRNKSRKLREAWEAAVGQDVAAHSRLVALRGGMLTVEVDSAPWLQELHAMGTDNIVAQLRHQLHNEQVVEMDVKLGTF